MLLYVSFVIFFIPASILTLAGAFTFGKIFGIVKGFFITIALVDFSATLGGVIAFLLGRKLFRGLIRRHLVDKVAIFEALDKGVTS